MKHMDKCDGGVTKVTITTLPRVQQLVLSQDNALTLRPKMKMLGDLMVVLDNGDIPKVLVHFIVGIAELI